MADDPEPKRRRPYNRRLSLKVTEDPDNPYLLRHYGVELPLKSKRPRVEKNGQGKSILVYTFTITNEYLGIPFFDSRDAAAKYFADLGLTVEI